MATSLATVYYDGLCMLCSTEIAHYRRCVGSSKILFVDICAPGFDAAAMGLDPIAIHKNMHVKRTDGTMAVGVDAFIEIWQILPRYRFLSRAAKVAGIRSVLNLSYRMFAAIRPHLPRRRASADACSASPYCDVDKTTKSK